LILADDGGVAEAICSQLESDLARAVLVHAGGGFERQSERVYEVDPMAVEDFERLLREVGGDDAGVALRVVHLWSLDVRSGECGSAEELMEWQRRSCGSVLHLVQAMARRESESEQRLWVVTRSAQAIDKGGEAEIEAGQSAVWGLGRVIGHEQPQQWGGLIDLDGGSSAAESAEQIARELRGNGESEAEQESEIGYRGGERYVPRLVRAGAVGREQEETAELRIGEEGSYLITGGMGGLGLAVGGWLVSQGARSVVLVGRSEPSAGALEEIGTMRAAGAEVACVQADVADVSRMREVIEEIGQEGKELRGIIHAAGVLDDGVLMGQKWARFERVMRGKVMGAWNLAELTRGKELDFFVMFSSAASLLGSPGQGNYAAANAYLDGLAAARERRGEVGLSINWGAWGEVGLAAHEHVARNIASRGMQSMKPAEAVAAMWHVMEQRREPQIFIMPLDVEKLRWVGFTTSLFRTLTEEAKNSTRESIARGIFRQTLLAAGSPQQQKSLLEQHLLQQISAVLRIPAAEIDNQVPLIDMGMDSLMALELRNRVEATLGLSNHGGANALPRSPNEYHTWHY